MAYSLHDIVTKIRLAHTGGVVAETLILPAFVTPPF